MRLFSSGKNLGLPYYALPGENLGFCMISVENSLLLRIVTCRNLAKKLCCLRAGGTQISAHPSVAHNHGTLPNSALRVV